MTDRRSFLALSAFIASLLAPLNVHAAGSSRTEGPSAEANQEAYYNSFNSNRAMMASPTYLDDPTGTRNEYGSTPIRGEPTNPNLNTPYRTVADYDYNRAAVNTMPSAQTMTDAQFLGSLDRDSRAIFLSLDREGRSLAIQLASQDSYQDKNFAVREAQRRMQERRGLQDR